MVFLISGNISAIRTSGTKPRMREIFCRCDHSTELVWPVLALCLFSFSCLALLYQFQFQPQPRGAACLVAPRGNRFLQAQPATKPTYSRILACDVEGDSQEAHIADDCRLGSCFRVLGRTVWRVDLLGSLVSSDSAAGPLNSPVNVEKLGNWEEPEGLGGLGGLTSCQTLRS